MVDKEIINSFQQEANALLEELREVIDRLEEKTDNFPKDLLEEFGNKTDRIMGTANTFSKMCPGQPIFIQMGKFCELCKVTSYKAATLNNILLIPIFAAFWADTVDILQDLVTHVESPKKVREVTRGYVPVLQKRLVWLAGQIVALTKGQDEVSATINVDGLLKKMGLDV